MTIEEPDEDEPLAVVADDDEDEVAAPAGQGETSFDELIAKHPEVVDDEDDESLIELTREERLESLSIRAAPKQANEFVCGSCHLVKHNSQLADKKRTLCRDCV
ncbi:MAG TPA: DUF4193 family protein [Actinomycetota bacterium]|nr:DUF4193 family protein [Actinomycetota bacterium]